ncbi:DEAD/DEAH box helicase [Ruegeria conchae]|uniref:DEAD/DEAH box helicase n=1 Tax=Ruegeria conchae TaxID=981384 RepID=UPI0021A356A3|nr:DEAD/DEAH box helicase [Ruegeria conchae]UWR03470.1 DEAD/DEAH box helicase [Ruegeria conchae]
MSGTDLQNWIVSDQGLRDGIRSLRGWHARRSLGKGTVDGLVEESSPPDWRKLLLASSVLAESDDTEHQEISLMIAQAAMQFGNTRTVRDAGAVVLTQLSNSRSISLAEQRGVIAEGILERLGVSETLLANRRLLESTIVLSDSNAIAGNSFQIKLWDRLKDSDWVSATAPTAAGKTYLVLNWLLGQLQDTSCRLAVFLAPTRALVTEIENELIELSKSFKTPSLRVSSLPAPEFGDLSEPTILVLTQERLHLFLNGFDYAPEIDITIVDEAQKLGDGDRGVLLQDAVERIYRTNKNGKFVFLSPHSENPDLLLSDAPLESSKSAVPGGAPTVTQNLIAAEQVFRRPQEWTLSFVGNEEDGPFGTITLHDRHEGSPRKKLAYVALALGRENQGTLVYANRPSDAEKIANIIYAGLEGEINDDIVDEELEDLSEFCKTSIHPMFQLVSLVKRGVAFHYGNMPTILRNEIERLFRTGKIRFLVCTSTLIEGVNLACRTIVVRGPKKGNGKHMLPQDFWNLAGRAGRWGADFAGNIVCVNTTDKNAWPKGVPVKSKFILARETDTVLKNAENLIEYIETRSNIKPHAIDTEKEAVTAYLLSWFARNESIADCPSIQRIPVEFVPQIDFALKTATAQVRIPAEQITAHPGISSVALQALLDYFANSELELDDLLPPWPESDDAAPQLKQVFSRINEHMAFKFGNDTYQWACTFTTLDWMGGKRIAQMIRGSIERYKKNHPREADEDIPYASLIRSTFEIVETVARFLAPKYLSAYLDVLRLHFQEQDRLDDFPENLKLDLFLEFGVSTDTLLSLIGIGLSRTSAIELNEYLARSDMSKEEVAEFLRRGLWETYDLQNVVKREVRSTVQRNYSSSE